MNTLFILVFVLFLIALFFSLAIYPIILCIDFIGLFYLLVYVAAVSILFLLILMLINVIICELLSDTSNILRTLLYRVYNLLEWELNSPPKPHSFVSLPVQSMPMPGIRCPRC